MFNKYIYTIHGCVPDELYSDTMLFRNILPQNLLLKFLTALPAKCRSTLQTIEHGGVALTIDDSTNASIDAAILARNVGHDVTVFLNPCQIEEGDVYWFNLVNHAFATTSTDSIQFRGTRVDINTEMGRQHARHLVKTAIRKCTAKDEVHSLVREFLESLQVDGQDIPEFMKPPSLERLRFAVNCGVRFENHLWDHWDIQYLDELALRGEILRAKTWLLDNLGLEATLFAPPFGEDAPKFIEHHSALYTYCLLSDSRFHSGMIGPRIYNRFGLTVRKIKRILDGQPLAYYH